jgi:hypothetical protein
MRRGERPVVSVLEERLVDGLAERSRLRTGPPEPVRVVHPGGVRHSLAAGENTRRSGPGAAQRAAGAAKRGTPERAGRTREG